MIYAALFEIFIEIMRVERPREYTIYAGYFFCNIFEILSSLSQDTDETLRRARISLDNGILKIKGDTNLEEYSKHCTEMKSPSTVSKSVKFGLHFIGIWPGTPLPGLHKILWVIAMVLFQGYQYKSIISRCRTDNLVSLIDSLSIVLPVTLVSIKLTISWIHHELILEILICCSVLCKLLSTMEEDCEKYAAIDTHKLIPKAADLSYRLTTITAVLYPLSAGFYAVGIFAFQQSNDSATRPLVVIMDLPFDTNESPVYELVVMTQFLFLTSSAFTFGIFSALLLMMTLHLGCQVDVLCHTLSDPSQIGNKHIRFFVSRQQEIVLFAERIEELFTYIALSQLFSNTLITCCLGYLIVITLDTENGLPMLIKSVLFYYCICLEAFIYCFAGEYLNIKSKLIGNTAYESLWYNMQPINSRQLVLLILRAQKGLPLTFGKFSNLNLESFTSIMKASASYMSVLLAMS